MCLKAVQCESNPCSFALLTVQSPLHGKSRDPPPHESLQFSSVDSAGVVPAWCAQGLAGHSAWLEQVTGHHTTEAAAHQLRTTVQACISAVQCHTKDVGL